LKNAVTERSAPPGAELKFIKLPEVLSICGIGKTTVYAAIKRGEFPIPAKQGRASVWEKGEVQGWVKSCMASRQNNYPAQVPAAEEPHDVRAAAEASQ
jgi:prophage regulatory protein